METSELRLVTDADPERPQDRSVPAALLLGALALGAFGLSTWLGADEARRKVEVAALAEAAVQMALERGSEDPQVRETLIELRRTLGWRPLESRTRVVYASLVLALSARAEDAQLAGFQAARAAELSPVTVSVVHAAVLVLSHTGELDHALALVRGMFGYDARRAARLLAQVDSLGLVASVDGAVPETAEAWMAWSRQLANDLRAKEAEAWLERTFDRWPDHLPARTRLAAGAFRRRDWTALGNVPPDGTFPTEPAAAPLLIWASAVRVGTDPSPGVLMRMVTCMQCSPSYSAAARVMLPVTWSPLVLWPAKSRTRSSSPWRKPLNATFNAFALSTSSRSMRGRPNSSSASSKPNSFK